MLNQIYFDNGSYYTKYYTNFTDITQPDIDSLCYTIFHDLHLNCIYFFIL